MKRKATKKITKAQIRRRFLAFQKEYDWALGFLPGAAGSTISRDSVVDVIPLVLTQRLIAAKANELRGSQ